MRRSLCLVVVAAALAAGCGATARPAAGQGPTVVTGVWALSQLAESVGGGAVRVVDVVPPGTDPRAPLTPAEVARVHSADVVLEVGGGYQPSFEAAAVGGRVVTVAAGAGAAADGPWLDPSDLDPVAARLASVLAAVAPGSASTFANGARDTAAEDSSLAADVHASLSVCPRTTVVTPDRTFTDLATAGGIVDRVAPSGVQGASTVFAEPFVDDGPLRAAAGAAGAKVASLDPMVGIPAGGYRRGETYQNRLEVDLAALTSGLGCPQD